MFAFAIRLLLWAGGSAVGKPKAFDTGVFLLELRALTEPHSPQMVPFIEELGRTLALSPSKAAAILSCTGGTGQYRRNHDHAKDGINGDAVSSLMWGLFSFLSAPHDFVKVLSLSVSAGGDTDSVAAIACALSGAYLGFAKLPRSLTLLIEDQGSLGAGLKVVTDGLFALHAGETEFPSQVLESE